MKKIIKVNWTKESLDEYKFDIEKLQTEEAKLEDMVKVELDKINEKEENDGIVTKKYHFTLFFDVSAMNISMADYDDVVVSALTDPDKFRGFGNQFTLSDIETGVNEQVIITSKNNVTDGRGNFQMAKLDVEITQEYYTDIEGLDETDQIKTPEQLKKAMENQLRGLEYYYRTSYDEGDIAHVSLTKVVFKKI